LDKRPTLKLKIRQHAQLFNRLRRQVLSFVDNQQNALVFPSAMQEELLEVSQQDRFARDVRTQTKLEADEGQQIVTLELRRHDVGNYGDLRVEFGKQRLNQCGFAGPDVTRDDDETVTLPQPVLQERKRALVFFAGKEKPRIRGELEGLSGKREKILVHPR
jgi:hypothetical protein